MQALRQHLPASIGIFGQDSFTLLLRPSALAPFQQGLLVHSGVLERPIFVSRYGCHLFGVIFLCTAFTTYARS